MGCEWQIQKHQKWLTWSNHGWHGWHFDIKNSFFFILFYFISRPHQHVILRQALGHTQENTFTLTHPASSKRSRFDKTLLSFVHEKKDCQISLRMVGPCFSLCLTQNKSRTCCIYCIRGREGKNSDIITCWVILDREQNP